MVNAVADANQGAPLRVFTLGIGETVSTAMCEGIARAGNGVCLMAATSESIIAKAAKLVRASRTAFFRDVTIDWGNDFDAPADVTSQSDIRRQAPQVLPTLYSGNRFIVFALLKHRDLVIPDKITIHARAGDGVSELAFNVPVDELAQPLDDSQPQLIHTLAARKIIQDMDDNDRNTNSLEIKAATIHLGEQYQLASRYTSFVAVDNNNATIADPVRQVYLPLEATVSRPRLFGGGPPLALPAGTSARARVGGKSPRKAMNMSPVDPANDSEGDEQHEREQEEVDEDDYDAVRYTHSSGSEGESEGGEHDTNEAADESAPRKRIKLSAKAEAAPAPAPISLSAFASGVGLDEEEDGYSEEDDDDDEREETASSGTLDNKILALIRLQSFTGSFPPSRELEAIVGLGTLDQADLIPVDKTVWATVLAVAYLQKNMANQEDILDGLTEKAMGFVGRYPDVDFGLLLEQAKSMII